MKCGDLRMDENKRNSEAGDKRGDDPVCTERCPYCGFQLEIVWVHGHGQCAKCGTNIDPCCGGASQ